MQCTGSPAKSDSHLRNKQTNTAHTNQIAHTPQRKALKLKLRGVTKTNSPEIQSKSERKNALVFRRLSQERLCHLKWTDALATKCLGHSARHVSNRARREDDFVKAYGTDDATFGVRCAKGPFRVLPQQTQHHACMRSVSRSVGRSKTIRHGRRLLKVVATVGHS